MCWNYGRYYKEVALLTVPAFCHLQYGFVCTWGESGNRANKRTFCHLWEFSKLTSCTLQHLPTVPCLAGRKKGALEGVVLMS